MVSSIEDDRLLGRGDDYRSVWRVLAGRHGRLRAVIVNAQVPGCLLAADRIERNSSRCLEGCRA